LEARAPKEGARIDVGGQPPSVPQSESEPEQFFDLSLDLLCVVGFDGYFKRVNPSLERTFGYSSRELLSRPFLEFTHPDDVQPSRDVLAELLRGNDVIGFESRIVCPDGSVRWLQWNTRTMPERGVVYGVARDVTDRRQADDELREAQRTAEASVDELRVLAEEQAALRRVAELVARDAAPEEVFEAVAIEASGLLDKDSTALLRYDRDGGTTIVAVRGGPIQVGMRVPTEGDGIAASVLRTGRASRIDSYRGLHGPAVDLAREIGMLAAVGAPIVAAGRLWGAIVVLTPGRPLPGGTEDRLAQFAKLVAAAIGNAESRTELTASRARIVAAADDERRRVVRDLHDGAQHRLVNTVITLKLARQALEDQADGAPALVSEALDHAQQATDELRELAHGILPGVLTHGGLRAGAAALASRTPVPVAIDVTVGRLPAAVEATAYFVVAEALTNVAKHARAGHAEVTARIEHDTLEVQVRDDGVGGAQHAGTGLVGLADRLAVLDGRLRVESPADGGTVVEAAIPLAGSGRP
jgi:PAS domain S-box-containing protein